MAPVKAVHLLALLVLIFGVAALLPSAAGQAVAAADDGSAENAGGPEDVGLKSEAGGEVDDDDFDYDEDAYDSPDDYEDEYDDEEEEEDGDEGWIDAAHLVAEDGTVDMSRVFDLLPPTSDKACRFSWARRRCEPVEHCQRKYQFLDATLGESCRLKKRPLTAKKVFPSWLKAKPAVVLTGAGALLAADLATIRYTSVVQRYPLLFNIVQGFVLFVSGDTLFQVLEQGWKEKVGVKLWRMTRAGLIGALNNGLIHYSWYKWIDRNFPYERFSGKVLGPADGDVSKMAVGFTKWAIEWPTMGAYKIASMYSLTSLMGTGLDGLKAKFKDTFLLTWLRSLQVWPLYDTLLYAYVPTVHRPLFNSFMSIAWGGYLSHVSQPEHHADGEGDDEEE